MTNLEQQGTDENIKLDKTDVLVLQTEVNGNGPLLDHLNDTGSSIHRLGIFGAKPKLLQKCNNVFFACMWLTIARILSTVLTAGVVGATLPHVEKRFGFTSQQSSYFIGIFDIASIPALIVASVFGAQCHKPRTIAFGMVLLSISCLVMVLPHFLTSYMPSLQHAENLSLNFCNEVNNTNNIECIGIGNNLLSTTYWALAAMLVGRIICAFGNTPLNTLAYNYMHDVSSKDHFNICVAALNMAMMFGAAVGYLAGASTLNLSHKWPYTTDFKESSSHFVGAWWLSYIILSITILAVALPIAAFPRDLPGAETLRKSRVTEAHNCNSTDDSETAIFVHWSDMGKHAKRLLKNIPFVSLSLYYSINYSTTNGFADFAPKLVEVGFGLSPQKAPIAAGITLVLAAPVGTLIATVCFFAPTLLTNCQGSNVRFNTSCSIDQCKCTNNEIQAVCGSDGFIYSSVCHAGCTTQNITSFTDCQCLTDTSKTVLSGPCRHKGCGWRLPVFLVLVFLFCVFLFAEQTLATTATVRVVSAPQRPMAVALQWIGIRLISPIFGPLSMGWIFDSSCSLWSKKCATRGSCEVYNAKTLSIYMMILQLGIHISSTIFASFARLRYKTPKEIHLNENITLTSDLNKNNDFKNEEIMVQLNLKANEN